MNNKLTLILILLLSLLGVWLSYLSLEAHAAHYYAPDSAPAICGISETLNCKSAIQSPYSTFLQFPIAGWGFLFYSIIALFALLGLVNNTIPKERVIKAVLIVSIAACLYSLFLFFISVFVLKSICPLCFLTYLINILLLITTWWFVRKSGVLVALLEGGKVLLNLPAYLVRSFLPKPNFFAYLVQVLVILCAVSAIVFFTLVLPGIATQRVIKHAVSKEFQLPWPKSNNAFPEKLQTDNSVWGDYYIGDLNAPIQIVEFFDYECPACKNFYHELKELLEDYYTGKYLLVFKNYPLDGSCNSIFELSKGHQNACFASNLARCAGEQGYFNEANNFLLSLPRVTASDKNLREEMLKVKQVLNLDELALNECLKSERQLKIIKRDIEQGNNLKLKGTPSLWINGRAAPRSLDLEILKKIFDDIVSSE